MSNIETCKSCKHGKAPNAVQWHMMCMLYTPPLWHPDDHWCQKYEHKICSRRNSSNTCQTERLSE